MSGLNDCLLRTILTPSYSGVMKELDTQAVGRWKNYEPFMRPYMDRLAPYIEAYGYAPS